MKKNYLFVFLFFFPNIFFAQTDSDKIIYLDSVNKEVSEGDHKYYRIVKEYSLDKEKYKFEDYYKSGKMKMEGYSIDKDHLTEVDNFVFYYENGNKQQTCSYSNRKLNGYVMQWYENGDKKLEGEYVQNKKDLIAELKTLQAWDQKQIQTVIDGNGKIEKNYGKSIESGRIKNGWRDGTWTGKDAFYKCSYTEFYKNGKLKTGTSTDSLSIVHTYEKTHLFARPSKGVNHFRKYIANKLIIPDSETGSNGKIIVQFTIMENGSIENIKVLKGLKYVLDELAIGLIRGYPDWSIAEYRGIKTKATYVIPILIKS